MSPVVDKPVEKPPAGRELTGHKQGSKEQPGRYRQYPPEIRADAGFIPVLKTPRHNGEGLGYIFPFLLADLSEKLKCRERFFGA